MLRNWLQKVACEKKLRGEDYRVLLILLAKADSQSVEISQTEIAQTLKIERSRVSRAIKRLNCLGLIEKKTIAGKLVGYRFLVDGS
ncbi:MAG: MarR family transcriptional regulator [Pleurocapsa sp. MO_226.B13]|nr:MarR family transcriptional regulator [Pleurocapsa sp. MO_226.B13]